MSASGRSFERDVALFLGGMADELPSGRSVPPQAMLRRARVHMTATAVVGAVFVAMTIILGTLASRGLLIGDGSFPGPALIGGAGFGDGSNASRAGTASRSGTPAVMPDALGPLSGAFDGYEGSYDRSVGGKGPDGGSWGGPVSRGATGGHSQPPGSGGDPSGGTSGSGGAGSGGTGWQPIPPPIWAGGSTGGFGPVPNPGDPAIGGTQDASGGCAAVTTSVSACPGR
jgi:hypothetical protein